MRGAFAPSQSPMQQLSAADRARNGRPAGACCEAPGLRCPIVTQTIDGFTLIAFLPFLAAAPILGLVLARKSTRPWSRPYLGPERSAVRPSRVLLTLTTRGRWITVRCSPSSHS